MQHLPSSFQTFETKILPLFLRPKWLTAFFLLTAISIALAVMRHPYVVESTLSHLPQSATPDEKQVVAGYLQGELTIRCLFLPVRLISGLFAYAIVLYAIVKALSPQTGASFGKIFSLAVRAEFVLILGPFTALLSMFISGSMQTNDTSLVPISPAVLIPGKDIVSSTLLNSLNFFTLLYNALLTFGISSLTGFSFPKSLLAVLLTWVCYLLANAGVISYIRDSMHLLI